MDPVDSTRPPKVCCGTVSGTKITSQKCSDFDLRNLEASSWTLCHVLQAVIKQCLQWVCEQCLAERWHRHYGTLWEWKSCSWDLSIITSINVFSKLCYTAIGRFWTTSRAFIHNVHFHWKPYAEPTTFITIYCKLHGWRFWTSGHQTHMFFPKWSPRCWTHKTLQNVSVQCSITMCLHH